MKKDEELFQVYIADSLYCLMHNMALTKKYSDIISPKSKEPEKTGDEIAADFLKRFAKGGEK